MRIYFNIILKSLKYIFLYGIPVVLIILYYQIFHLGYFAEYLGDPNSILPFFTSLLTYVYVVITWSMVKQMILNRDLDRRPYVSVDIEFENAMGYVVVQNHGLSPATNINITFLPELVATRNRKVSETLFAKPISFLPPGRTLRSFIDSGVALLHKDAPGEYTAKVEYSWSERRMDYNESCNINLNFYKWRLGSRASTLKDVTDQLEKVSVSLDKIANNRKR